ncbi:hypothetical protein ACO22_05020 [Paracoccidioides brasiliensis]|uniref:Uncharacterized protein n=1 Tax=Paracoccidioides brasiliensis TaxID=121759 RepID=A0A1D2JBT0_PARBR|nr:hypothetical protein ACO22_05020 [Paracoccidioides brasiliensis]ODH53510.1 hypothetical protein GX48_00343 [Paracoccidioides brasiliensis]
MTESQQYWLPGYGLSRHIVLSQIQYFLGPTSSARPYSYQGREGYLVTGTPLTRQQIEDLANMSLEYEKGAAMRMAHNNFNFNADGKSSEQYVNELISVGMREKERDRVSDRNEDREREGESDRWRCRRYSPLDRRSRHKQSW